MITASHNPFTDNGIKTFYNEAKLDVEVETQIEAFIDSDEIIKSASIWHIPVYNRYGRYLFSAI